MGFVTDVVLPIALAFIMLALGLGLTFDDFCPGGASPAGFRGRCHVADRRAAGSRLPPCQHLAYGAGTRPWG